MEPFSRCCKYLPEWIRFSLDRAHALVLSIFIALLFQVPSQSHGDAQDSSCNVTSCWVAVGAPKYAQFGAYDAFKVNYTNLINADVVGIVFAVVHNVQGQTVAYSTDTLELAAGASGTATPIEFGLEPGIYSVTFFVTSTAGTAISGSMTMTFFV